MTEISLEILQKFQIRKTTAQKDAFIDFMLQQFPNIQIQKHDRSKSKNLILGDISNAEILLSAHYDTCSVLPFPNFISPKNFLLYLGYMLLILVPVFAILILCSTLLRLFTDEFWIHYFVLLFLYFGLFILLLAGPPNKHTANDNTSGVITLCEIYTNLTEEEREKVAFLFFDNEENGLLGSRAFKIAHKDMIYNQLLINFDCVSDGDHILFASTKKAREKWQIASYFPINCNKTPMFEKAEHIFYPSDQKGFPNSVAVAALKHNRFLGYYINRIHTPRDTIFDQENINYLQKGTHALIADICTISKKSTEL